MAFRGISPGSLVYHAQYEEPQPLVEGVNTFPYAGEYTIRGTFTMLGADVFDTEEINLIYESTPFYSGAITRWEDTKTRDISCAFTGSHLSYIASPPQSIDDMSQAFFKARSVPSLNHWDTSSVTSMFSMFGYAQEFSDDTELRFDTSAVTNMSYMFYEAATFDQDISFWDTSNVTSMNAMFCFALSFNQDISHWDVSAVQDMSYMFNGVENFHHNLSTWEVSDTVKVDYMFPNVEYFEYFGIPDNGSAQYHRG